MHVAACPSASIPPQVFAELLKGVDRAARYVGGELNSVVKEGPLRARVALGFADVYEVAESHIGLKILYDMINDREDFAAERAYAFWPDMEARARELGVPLFSLETRRPLNQFDLVGFTLQYELAYPTMLAMLELGGIPLRAAERSSSDAFVIGGGAGAFNPEPIAPFFDAFLLGDGEPVILQIVETVARAREEQLSRADTLLALGALEGMYVPSHYRVSYRGLEVTAITALPGTPKADQRSKHGTPRIGRVTLADLDAAPYPTRPIVPNVKPVHDRVAVEIQRGCSQACRFCQAGMITRPTRQRRPETVLRLADETLKNSGKDEVGLLSLSAGDYQPINRVLGEFFSRYKDDNIAIGLPSMRTETMTPELAQQVAQVRKTGFTFAPEAGSERMRRVINKTNSEADLMAAVRATTEAGWRHLKFYFMIGLPTETLEDVDAIAALAERARQEARRIRPGVNVTVSVSTFVPKPHTAFQWEAQIGVEETVAKHQRLRRRLRHQNIGFRYHDADQSFLEGVLSRGDRRLADMLEDAARRGCRFDAWSEHHHARRWKEIYAAHEQRHGFAVDLYLSARVADDTSLLPWDHLHAGILKKFLKRDRARSYAEGNIEDCALTGHCYACGGCDLGDPYRAKLKNAAGERLITLRPVVRTVEPSAPAAEPSALVTEPSALAAEPSALAAEPTSPPGSNSRRRPEPPQHHDPVVPVVSRIRLRYGKLGPAFYFSHLGVKEHIERALRMARLPVAYSRGFNPRPKLSFSPACPTGVSSEAEYVDMDFTAEVAAEEVVKRLAAGLPHGIVVFDALAVSPKGPSINHLIVASDYLIELPRVYESSTLSARVEEICSSWLAVQRKGKRKLLRGGDHLLLAELTSDRRRLRLRLAFAQSGSLRPREALLALFDAALAEECSIRKTAIELSASVPAAVVEQTEVSETPLVDLRLTAPVLVAQGRGRRDRKGANSESLVVPYAE